MVERNVVDAVLDHSVLHEPVARLRIELLGQLRKLRFGKAAFHGLSSC